MHACASLTGLTRAAFGFTTRASFLVSDRRGDTDRLGDLALTVWRVIAFALDGTDTETMSAVASTGSSREGGWSGTDSDTVAAMSLSPFTSGCAFVSIDGTVCGKARAIVLKRGVWRSGVWLMLAFVTANVPIPARQPRANQTVLITHILRINMP
jgi:hypothetical protein